MKILNDAYRIGDNGQIGEIGVFQFPGKKMDCGGGIQKKNVIVPDLFQGFLCHDLFILPVGIDPFLIREGGSGGFFRIETFPAGDPSVNFPDRIFGYQIGNIPVHGGFGNMKMIRQILNGTIFFPPEIIQNGIGTQIFHFFNSFFKDIIQDDLQKYKGGE